MCKSPQKHLHAIVLLSRSSTLSLVIEMHWFLNSWVGMITFKKKSLNKENKIENLHEIQLLFKANFNRSYFEMRPFLGDNPSSNK